MSRETQEKDVIIEGLSNFSNNEINTLIKEIQTGVTNLKINNENEGYKMIDIIASLDSLKMQDSQIKMFSSNIEKRLQNHQDKELDYQVTDSENEKSVYISGSFFKVNERVLYNAETKKQYRIISTLKGENNFELMLENQDEKSIFYNGNIYTKEESGNEEYKGPETHATASNNIVLKGKEIFTVIKSFDNGNKILDHPKQGLFFDNGNTIAEIITLFESANKCICKGENEDAQLVNLVSGECTLYKNEIDNQDNSQNTVNWSKGLLSSLNTGDQSMTTHFRAIGDGKGLGEGKILNEGKDYEINLGEFNTQIKNSGMNISVLDTDLGTFIVFTQTNGRQSIQSVDGKISKKNGKLCIQITKTKCDALNEFNEIDYNESKKIFIATPLNSENKKAYFSPINQST